MRQAWHDLLFMHWPVDAAALRPLVPPSLPLDTYEGQAWIGVVPFRMSGIRLRGTPALPWLSAFPELNVRTYVRVGDKPGVYFFSLDADNPIAVAVARRWFHLPYYWSRMTCRAEGDRIRYRSERRSASADFAAEYRPCGPAAPAAAGTLDYWLTERYCLYTADASGRLARCEIAHGPWPLQPAEAVATRNRMTEPLGFSLPQTPPRLLFSKIQDVWVWAPERIHP